MGRSLIEPQVGDNNAASAFPCCGPVPGAVPMPGVSSLHNVVGYPYMVSHPHNNQGGKTLSSTHRQGN